MVPPGSGESGVEVREARNADAAAVAPLLAELGFPTPLPTIGERIDSMIDAGELVLVASLEGNLVGLVTAHATPVLHRPTPVGRLTDAHAFYERMGYEATSVRFWKALPAAQG